MEKKRLSIWAPVLVLATALLMLAVSAEAVDAARGGNASGGSGQCRGGPKKCGGGGDTGTAVLSVTPNPVPLGSQSVEIHGTGFAPNQTFGVRIYAVCCAMFAYSDATGAFTVTFYRDFDWPDTYTVEASSAEAVLATTTFTVQ